MIFSFKIFGKFDVFKMKFLGQKIGKIEEKCDFSIF